MSEPASDMTARVRGLHRKLASFTVRPCEPPFDPVEPRDVVVVLPGGDMARGFAVARRLLDEGRPVRLLGPAATLSRTWPAWVTGRRDLWLTEIAALKSESTAVASYDLEHAIMGWLDELFGDALGPLSASRALYAAACMRVFQPLVASFPIVRGVVDGFPEAVIHCADGTGIEAEILGRVTSRKREPPSPGSATRGSARRVAPWPLQATAAVAVAFLGATMVRARDLVAARGPLRDVGSRRGKTTPKTWVALVGDWERLNRHLVDAFALPALRSGESLGVLVLGSMRPGRRVETDFSRADGTEFLSGLSGLGSHVDDCEIDQALTPETLRGIVRAWLGAGRLAGRAARRLAAADHIALPGFSFDLRPRLWALAKLIALDGMRAVFTRDATRDLVERRGMTDATVLFCGTCAVDFATVSMGLQEAGATTVDHPHGATGDSWTGHASTEATFRCLWTLADARSVGPAGRQLLVTGMPRRRTFTPRSRRPRNILITSNYVHRDAMVEGRLPLRPFQQELLSLVVLLRQRQRSELCFRWRPHPADFDEPVAEDLGTLHDVDLSRGRSLDDDAEWADLVITSYSTVLVELILAELPVFVQPTPDLWGLPATDFLDPSRMFFRASDGAAKIALALDAWAEGDPTWLAPERGARLRLFGATGAPVAMTDYFGAGARVDPMTALVDLGASRAVSEPRPSAPRSR